MGVILTNPVLEVQAPRDISCTQCMGIENHKNYAPATIAIPDSTF